MKDIGVFGTSGFAREVGDIAYDLGFRVVYVAENRDKMEAVQLDEEIILEEDVHRYRNMKFAVGIGEPTNREKVAHKFGSQIEFVNLLHPAATFGRGQRQDIESRRGVIIFAGVRFSNNIRVGNFTAFNPNSTVGHDVTVDDYVNVAPGACISGNVHIGKRSWIGTGAAINQGTVHKKLVIGADTVIGSGAVVIESCHPGAVYAGVPAKRIK